VSRGGSETRPRRILVVGAGAREHALAWKLSREPGVEEVFRMPERRLGLAGAEAADAGAAEAGGDINRPADVVDRAKRLGVDLVVVGPEGPLAAGVADALAYAWIPTFGPTAAAARIESSKAFCREIAAAAGVPMADGTSFGAEDRLAARAYAAGMAARTGGVVVKADGLAAGKGVTVCSSADEADAAIDALEGPLVVEERLVGREASVMAICDGRTALALPISRDHKRLLDGDRGPNTGGMGAYSPLADLPDEAADEILEHFHQPVLAELARRGAPFHGALYAGLMLTADGPRLLEFNARLGDPETQVVLPRLADDLAPLLLAAARGRFQGAAGSPAVDGRRLPTVPGAAVGIVLASEGYPGSVRPGARIRGLDDDGQLPGAPDALVFHAGTTEESAGVFLATGGRVLTVVGRGADVAAARSSAESAADRITWPGQQRRRDIAAGTPAMTRVAA
jgi:phosphoribosylamine---glycine ligase